LKDYLIAEKETPPREAAFFRFHRDYLSLPPLGDGAADGAAEP
jgi:hypothetical protein